MFNNFNSLDSLFNQANNKVQSSVQTLLTRAPRIRADRHSGRYFGPDGDTGVFRSVGISYNTNPNPGQGQTSPLVVVDPPDGEIRPLPGFTPIQYSTKEYQTFAGKVLAIQFESGGFGAKSGYSLDLDQAEILGETTTSFRTMQNNLDRSTNDFQNSLQNMYNSRNWPDGRVPSDPLNFAPELERENFTGRFESKPWLRGTHHSGGKGTPYENEDPVSFGFEVRINGDSSPLLNGEILHFMVEIGGGIGNKGGAGNAEVFNRKPILDSFCYEMTKYFKFDTLPYVFDTNHLDKMKLSDDQRNLLKNLDKFDMYSTTLPKRHYVKKIEGLDTLVERNAAGKNQGFVKYQEDLIKLTFYEDISGSTGTLLNLYKLLTWSRIAGKSLIPDNLLKFDCEIIITEIRNMARVRTAIKESSAGGGLQTTQPGNVAQNTTAQTPPAIAEPQPLAPGNAQGEAEARLEQQRAEDLAAERAQMQADAVRRREEEDRLEDSLLGIEPTDEELAATIEQETLLNEVRAEGITASIAFTPSPIDEGGNPNLPGTEEYDAWEADQEFYRQQEARDAQQRASDAQQRASTFAVASQFTTDPNQSGGTLAESILGGAALAIAPLPGSAFPAQAPAIPTDAELVLPPQPDVEVPPPPGAATTTTTQPKIKETPPDISPVALQVIKDNLTRYVYKLYECQLHVPNLPHPTSVDMAAPTTFYDSHTVEISFKHSELSFERFDYNNFQKLDFNNSSGFGRTRPGSDKGRYLILDNGFAVPYKPERVGQPEQLQLKVDETTGNPSIDRTAGYVDIQSVAQMFFSGPPGTKGVIDKYQRGVVQDPSIVDLSQSDNILSDVRRQQRRDDFRAGLGQAASKLGNELKRVALTDLQKSLNDSFNILNDTLTKVKEAYSIGGITPPKNVYETNTNTNPSPFFNSMAANNKNTLEQAVKNFAGDVGSSFLGLL